MRTKGSRTRRLIYNLKLFEYIKGDGTVPILSMYRRTIQNGAVSDYNNTNAKLRYIYNGLPRKLPDGSDNPDFQQAEKGLEHMAFTGDIDTLGFIFEALELPKQTTSLTQRIREHKELSTVSFTPVKPSFTATLRNSKFAFVPAAFHITTQQGSDSMTINSQQPKPQQQSEQSEPQDADARPIPKIEARPFRLPGNNADDIPPSTYHVIPPERQIDYGGFLLHLIYGVDHIVDMHDAEGNGLEDAGIWGNLIAIPGVKLLAGGEESPSFRMPVDTTVTIKFRTKEELVMEFKHEAGTKNQPRVIRYQDVEVPAGTMAMVKTTPQGMENLRLDMDGDGIFEREVQPTVDVKGNAALDKDPPLVDVTARRQGDSTLATVTITATDSETGVKQIRYWLGEDEEAKLYTAPFTIDTAKTPIVYADADDNVANRSSFSEELFDFAPPTTTATASPQPVSGKWNTSDVTVTLRASEIAGASGVARITYRLTGAQAVPETIVNGDATSLVITAEGETSITYYATDNAGNTEAAKTLTVKIAKSVTPAVSFTERVQGTRRLVTINTLDADVKSVRYSLDGVNFKPYTTALTVDPTVNPTVHVLAEYNTTNRSSRVTYKPLTLTTSVARDTATGEIVVTATIRNEGTAEVTSNFVLKNAKLNNKPTTTTLPLTINTLDAGETLIHSLRFPATAAKPNTRATLSGSGTSHGAAFGGGISVVVP